MKLDNRDIAILSVLSRNGRIAKSDLAERVNLSPTSCWERMRKLEKAGLIKGYRADIDLARLGPSVTVFVTVELEQHRAESFRLFEGAIQRLPSVTSCWAIGGGYDYLIQVVAPDIPSFQTMMDGLLDSSAGMRRYFSYIVTKSIKQEPAITAMIENG